ncbi:MAG TPA: YlxR family protein [Streptosporangiaceae bacterium]|nr:YlxR family protein [Streptosporangiaceae bacterium]
MCVGCRTRAVKSDLLRVVAVDGEIVVDPAARSPGRGAYLHPSEECFEQARRRKAFPRALRVTGTLVDDGLARYLAQA